jgi:hypothetical protein
LAFHRDLQEVRERVQGHPGQHAAEHLVAVFKR